MSKPICELSQLSLRISLPIASPSLAVSIVTVSVSISATMIWPTSLWTSREDAVGLHPLGLVAVVVGRR